MGAWEVGNFGNDDALDWVNDLIEEDNIDIILKTLNKITRDKNGSFLSFFKKPKSRYIEAPEASEALAAAETVAALKGKASKDIPIELADWVKSKLNIDLNELFILAKEAVKIIKDDSELKELWEETDNFTDWIIILNELEKRLG